MPLTKAFPAKIDSQYCAENDNPFRSSAHTQKNPLTKTFSDKIDRWNEDKLPNLRQYCASNDDPFPFADEPSGSHWTLSHIEWLRVDFYWDCDIDRLFTKKSRFEESGPINQFLQDRLSLSWSEVTTGHHEPGSFYERLSALATWTKSTPLYEHQYVPPSSSPAGSQGSDHLKMPQDIYGTPSSDKLAIRPASEASPSLARSGAIPSAAREGGVHGATRQSGQPSAANAVRSSQDWDSSPEPSSSDTDAENQPVPFLPSAPTEESGRSKLSNKLEKDVEFAALAFQCLIIQAYQSTAASTTAAEAKEQDLTFEVGSAQRGLDIEIDGYRMRSHPDLAGGLLARRTKVEIVVEAKSPNHRLPETRLLGQQVSELLGAALNYRRVYKQEYYNSYLISWHFLECYITRMEVSEQYLSILRRKSRKLSTCAGPELRRSPVFDMKDPEQRVQFARLAARIGIELLYQYPTHRGHGTGLIRRLRGVTPHKLPADG